VVYYIALKNAGVPAAMHLYARQKWVRFAAHDISGDGMALVAETWLVTIGLISEQVAQ